MTNNTLNWPEGASIFKDGKFYTLSGKPVGHAGVALDAAPTISDAEVKAKIERAKRKVALDAEEDALAELRIGLLMPTLRAMVMDNIEAEQAVLSEAEQGEAEDEQPEDATLLRDYGFSAVIDDRLARAIEASHEETRRYWDGVKAKAAASRRQSQAVQRTGRYAAAGNRKQAQAADHIGHNAKAARQYSAFATSAQLCNASK